MESPKSQSSSIEKDLPKYKEDDSHLPPCLQRRNREHSSSSEDDEPKSKMNEETSDSQSDSDDDSPSHEAGKDETEDNIPKKPDDKEICHPKKGRHSHSKSRSRSRSPTRKRRRKSSDRSVRNRHSRSRSRDRHRRKKRSNRSRSRERRRSRDRDHHRRKHRHSSRSRSRDRKEKRSHRRSRSRERKRSHRSRSRERSNRDHRRHRSRSRSASPGSIKFGEKTVKPGASFGRPTPSSKPLTFKDKMRQQLMKCIEEGKDVGSTLMNADGSVMCSVSAGTNQSGQTIPASAVKKPPVPLMGTMVTSTASLAPGTISASEAVMQSMIQLQKETTARTGVEIPKFYNPAAINPVKYAEQVQKRKLLWSKTKDKDVDTKWNATSLSSDSDDKSKEKFRKLMGIHGKVAEKLEDAEVNVDTKQKELFEGLDREYQLARMSTHTHRGIGLGFGTVAGYQPLSQPAPAEPPTTSPS